MTATREQLKSTGGKRRFGVCTLPVSGLEVRYRSLTARELAEYQAANFDRQGQVKPRAYVEMSRRLFIAAVCDEDGNPILSGEDLGWLGEMDGADADFLNDRISEHCGLRRADSEAIRKNSNGMPSGDTPSALPTDAAMRA